MSANEGSYFQPLINERFLKKYALDIDDLPDYTLELTEESYLELETWLQEAIDNMLITGGSSLHKSQCLAIFTVQNIVEDYVTSEFDKDELVTKMKKEEASDFELLKETFVDHFPVYNQKKTKVEKDSEIEDEIVQNLISLHIVTTNHHLEDSQILQLEKVLRKELQNNNAYKEIQKIIEESEEIKKIQELLSDEQPLDLQFKRLADFLPESKSAAKKQVNRVIDIYREEHKARFAGPGPVELPAFHDLGQENYSIDREWMTNVVLIAKNVYVWLSQLSRKYQKDISTLDAIPEEELKMLKKRGINAIWLIGIWNRSTASKKIKRKMGNPEAIASAYSVYNYEIDEKLGGEASFKIFKQKMENHELRIGCDVIPNHTGIYSEWIIDHPEWYISTDNPPYPSYSFTGEDLSENPDVSIYIEDKYWNKTDAAVVFKYIDHRDDTIRYIYHGNDGTSTPWNDTAQLNYLNKNARDAMIDQILRVGRDFDLIRFDAAMTLTKQHYQRLWYPEPGSGGDIPSRYRFAMTKEKFDSLMPYEFWSEVVWRVNHSDIDTLLLAEAFWLLEGYFVRTLGMHRVYNSAFMHLLRDQENEKFHQMIAQTLEFDPRLLQRYVNFMSNPDEDTATGQFGNGDKYFGICTLLSTIPGLPMFGHGQIQGFHEKYGMEFARDYYNEDPNPHLVERHAKEIFPLLHMRALFSSVDRFRFYQPKNSNSNYVNDIYAYNNGSATEQVLITYNNQIERLGAWIRESYPINFEPLDTPKSNIQKTHLLQDFGLENLPQDTVIVFEELKSQLIFARNVNLLQSQGLYVELNGYQVQLFSNFQVLPSFPKLDEDIQNKLKTDGISKQKLTKIVPEFDTTVSLYR